jgi:Raf kinase inhibitor-like YbhB/YbcL family protein
MTAACRRPTTVRLVRRAALSFLVAGLAATACSTGEPTGTNLPRPSAPESLRFSSSSFSDGGDIPAKYTCDGASISPGLAWSETKPAKEFVLLMTDPDAPSGTFVHWVMYAIPANAESIGEGQGPSGAKQGVNDFGRGGYGAPCPPAGDPPHRYQLTLYALSAPRTARIPQGATARAILAAIQCCVQEQGTIVGTYQR